jgi:hypothetical protein
LRFAPVGTAWIAVHMPEASVHKNHFGRSPEFCVGPPNSNRAQPSVASWDLFHRSSRSDCQ